MSSLQPYYPASKIRVVQKTDALFGGGGGGMVGGETERKEDEKNYLYLPNTSQIRKYIRHISKPTKFVNGLQRTSKTFCESRTTQHRHVDLLCAALFQHHLPSPSLNHKSLHLTCGSCFVSI